jgi:pterin-4a-carbinolamine dehydratase/1-acyl-sn-glycerol-3-phosphate acyltransferase
MPPPPRWVRRLVLAPAVVALAFLALITLPLWLLLAAAASPLVPGRLRPLRLVWISLFYLVLNAAALVVMFGLWLASGFGWKKRSPAFRRAHYGLTGWCLAVLFWQVRWTLRLRIAVTGPDPLAVAGDGPALVLCRHAGPGDSFILIHALLNWYKREPRVVLKDALQWDPAVDVLLNRLPNQFVAPGHRRGDWSAAQMAGALAAGLDDDDVMVIFPEGGKFTPRRRLAAIDRLRSRGLSDAARRAERLRHVLAPQPGGVLAALDAAPRAGVIFVAHTGLERMVTVADVWRELPMDKQITMRFWAVPAGAVPAGRAERIEWLYEWWRRIDNWIDSHQPTPVPRRPSPPVPVPDPFPGRVTGDGRGWRRVGMVGSMAELLQPEEVRSALGTRPGWSGDPSGISRTVGFASFPDAIAVVDRIAVVAEELDHHPDIDIRWRNLTFRCVTHSAGGLTARDLDLASRIDEIVAAAGGRDVAAAGES